MADLNFFQRLNEATKTYDTDPQPGLIKYGTYRVGGPAAGVTPPATYNKPAAPAAPVAPRRIDPRTGRVARSEMTYGEGLRADLPDTSAVVEGTIDDVSDDFSEGRYAGGVARGLRGALATVPAVLNDTVGAGLRYLREPGEDAGRAILGMPDRVAPTAAPSRVTPTFSPDDQSAAETRRLRENNAGLQRGLSPFGNLRQNDVRPGISEPPQKIQVDIQPNGTKSFSGTDITGTNLEYSDGRKSNPIGIVPGMSQADIDKTLTNPDGSRWTAEDNAMMAANLRNGRDPYRNTSRGKADQLRELALSAPGTSGRRFAQEMLRQQLQNDASLEAARMQRDASVYGSQTTAASARERLKFDAEKDKRDAGVRRTENTLKLREEADKNLTSELQTMFTTKNDKGESVVDNGAVAVHKAAITSHIGNLIMAAEKRGDTETATALREQGASALGKDRLQKLILQLEVKRRSQLAHSAWNPFGGSHVDSTDPSGYDIVGVKDGILQDQYKTRNGSTIPKRLIDYTGGGGTYLPNDMVDTPTTRFQPIIKPRGE